MTLPLASDLIRSFVERVERIEEEITGLNTDKKEIFAEAKSQGLDVKVLKSVISRRRQGDATVSEFDELVSLYEQALAGAPARTHERQAA